MVTWLIGGAGFIGSELAGHLSDMGREVLVLGRGASPANPLPSAVRYVSGDYGDPAVVERVARSADEIVHLAYATVPHESFRDPVSDVELNLPPMVRLLQTLSSHSLRKLVLVSSG